MEECVKQGLTKSIGLSNFNSEQIQRVLDIATIKPVVNQVLLLNSGHHKYIKTEAVLLM
jgi:diketogulonate reductase-like aldo/keto reductase